MGSLDAALISGFLCRLCSEMHRTVIHIYGDQGLRQQIARKINEYLPVTISPTDPLPKTICHNCWSRVQQHHELMQTLQRNRAIFEEATRQGNSTGEVFAPLRGLHAGSGGGGGASSVDSAVADAADVEPDSEDDGDDEMEDDIGRVEGGGVGGGNGGSGNCCGCGRT